MNEQFDEVSIELFGRSYDELDDQEQEIVRNKTQKLEGTV